LVVGSLGTCHIFGETDAYYERCSTYSLTATNPNAKYFEISAIEFVKYLKTIDPQKLKFTKYCLQADTNLANKLA